MPKIKTPDGYLHYRTIPLFPGVKQIDKTIAFENLIIFKEILDKYQIPFMLSYGTLLGAIREKDFIDHDEDIDITIKEEFRNKFLCSLKELYKFGFQIVRYDRRDLYSIMRKGEYIDIYFFHPINNHRWECSGSLSLDEFFKEPDIITFQGIQFQTHSNHLDYLVLEYGPNWGTPIKWNNYSMSKWKLALLKAKEYAKDILPDRLYFILANNASRHLTDKYETLIDRYLKLKSTN